MDNLFKIFFLSIFFLASCAQNEVKNDFPTADLEKSSSPKLYPGVSLNELKKVDSVPTIGVAGQNGIGDFGPTPVSDESPRELKFDQTKKLPAVALILGPGINRVIAHISLLKNLKNNKVPVHIVSGTGLGAVVAALYASGMTPEKIEWNFFKFFSKSNEVRPYSNKWISLVEKILIKKFENKAIQSLKRTFILPLYDKKTHKIHYYARGKLYDMLYYNMLFYGPAQKVRFSTAMQRELYNGQQFKNIGADIVVGVDVLGKNINFKRGEDFLVGVFGKALSTSDREKDSLDFYFNLRMDDMFLDSIDNLPDFIKTSYEVSSQISKKLKEAIENWDVRGSTKEEAE